MAKLAMLAARSQHVCKTPLHKFPMEYPVNFSPHDLGRQGDIWSVYQRLPITK